MDYWFWTVFCGLILGWYILVTIVVAYKGWGNIRSMIENLKEKG
ncbi:hypothetical protein [Spongiimicrobium sp. 3-5]